MNNPQSIALQGAISLTPQAALGYRGASQAPRSEASLVGVRGFVRWFKEQHDAGEIAMPVEGLLSVQPALSSRFCVGLHGHRYFVGIPKEWCDWFTAMPWACVCVDPASGRLAFISREATAPGLVVPAFALSFDVSPAGYSQALAHYHYLDIRSVEPLNDSTSLRISREVHLTASIRIDDPLTLLSDLGAESL